MGVRTTATDGGYFIFDSVTGLAIGEIWQDANDMEQFLAWYNTKFSDDLRKVSTPVLNSIIANFYEERGED